jgi:hypothetical protein
VSIEQAIKITNQLNQTRETVRTIYGMAWREKLKPYVAVLEGLHQEKGLPYLDLGQQIAREMQDQGINPLMVLAAVVELIDPTAA